MKILFSGQNNGLYCWGQVRIFWIMIALYLLWGKRALGFLDRLEQEFTCQLTVYV